VFQQAEGTLPDDSILERISGLSASPDSETFRVRMQRRCAQFEQMLCASGFDKGSPTGRLDTVWGAPPKPQRCPQQIAAHLKGVSCGSRSQGAFFDIISVRCRSSGARSRTSGAAGRRCPGHPAHVPRPSRWRTRRPRCSAWGSQRCACSTAVKTYHRHLAGLHLAD